MSWTIACFCGTLYQTPLERCPTCDRPLPDVRSNDPIDTATHDARPMMPHDASVEPTSFGFQFRSAGAHELQLPAGPRESAYPTRAHPSPAPPRRSARPRH